MLSHHLPRHLPTYPTHALHILQDDSLGFQALLGGPWCFFPAMVRTSPFAWAKRRNPKSSFHGWLLYQVPAVSFRKRTNISQDTISTSTSFLYNLVAFFRFFSQQRKAGLVFAMSFQRKPTTDKGARSRPPTVKKVTWTPKLPLCPTGPWRNKTPTQCHRPTRVTAWDGILGTSTHQQSDSWLLFTNE